MTSTAQQPWINGAPIHAVVAVDPTSPAPQSQQVWVGGVPLPAVVLMDPVTGQPTAPGGSGGGGESLPAGSIVIGTKGQTIDGFLECDGSIVPASVYPSLVGVLPEYLESEVKYQAIPAALTTSAGFGRMVLDDKFTSMTDTTMIDMWGGTVFLSQYLESGQDWSDAFSVNVYDGIISSDTKVAIYVVDGLGLYPDWQILMETDNGFEVVATGVANPNNAVDHTAGGTVSNSAESFKNNTIWNALNVSGQASQLFVRVRQNGELTNVANIARMVFKTLSTTPGQLHLPLASSIGDLKGKYTYFMKF